jgi:hypothetical protein
MNTSSETTWTAAASIVFKKPRAGRHDAECIDTNRTDEF